MKQCVVSYLYLAPPLGKWFVILGVVEMDFLEFLKTYI
jgi:hypothetical protein